MINSIPDFSRYQYQPVGRCIYCRATGSLQNEHIVPVGLDGRTTLPKASCAKCAKITMAFERSVLRGPMWPLRIMRRVRSRRPEEAPTKYKLRVVIRGVEQVIEVPLKEYPILVPFLEFPPPEFLGGNYGGNGVTITAVTTVGLLGESAADAAHRLRVETIKIDLEFDPNAFARLVAKIGYAWTIAEFGLDAITDHGLVASILGSTPDIGRWVGVLEEVPPPSVPGLLHHMKMQFNPEKRLLFVTVRLFSDMGTPTYAVVIGTPRDGRFDELASRTTLGTS